MLFSDEQAMLLDTAVEFCKQHSSITQVRDLLPDDCGFDPAVWQRMVELGWTGVAIPEAYGGSGLGLAATVPLQEPMGRHLLATPFFATQLAVQALLAGGSEDQKAEWLPRLAAGAPATIAVTEASGDWDLRSVDARLESSGGGLTGVKTQVLNAPESELLLASVAYDGAPALVLLDSAALAEAQISREVVLDETRRSYAVNLDGLVAEQGSIISGTAATLSLAAIEQAAWLLCAADACGGINATIDLVVDYLNTRTQFGRKIGSYQALKHPTVDMLMQLERARSHVYHSASLIAAGDDPIVALRMAKAASDDAYNFAADRAIQFHGGFGFTYECDAQLYLRRALWLQYQYGDAPHQRAKLQNLLLDSSS